MNDALTNIKPVAWIRGTELSLLARNKGGLGTYISHNRTAPEQASLFDRSALDAAYAAGFAECRERAKEACLKRIEFASTYAASRSPRNDAIDACMGDIAALQPAEQKEASDG